MLAVVFRPTALRGAVMPDAAVPVAPVRGANMRPPRLLAGLLALVLTLALAGCERAAKNMYDQPRGKPYKASTLFPDGAMSRTPPPGIVAYARGSAADTSSGREGAAAVDRDRQAQAATALPDPITPAMLRQGRTLYGVYCLPCHSPAGDGDGRIVQRGFPAPPSYHSDRLRAVPDRHIYDVISNGFGVMAAYGNRIEPADRWAIVAFVRALQLSQHATPDRLSPQLRTEVMGHLSPAQRGDKP